MAYTTHEQIRVQAGFQYRYVNVPFLVEPTAGATTFYVDSDHLVKFVPEFNTNFVDGGRVRGRLYDITEEQFRYKDYQENVNRNQPGSGNYNSYTRQ